MEKKNFRDTLMYLGDKYPMLINKNQLSKILGVSQPTLRKLIKKNNWYFEQGKISLCVIANYLS